MKQTFSLQIVGPMAFVKQTENSKNDSNVTSILEFTRLNI